MSSRWIGGVLLGALWATAAWAQAPLAGGAVIGDVRDRTGAARPGVTVTLNGVERRATWSRQTDAQGHFRFAPVDVGAYRLIVELDGFVTVKRQFELALGQTVALDVELQPAATASVQVTAETAVLDTARTDASHVLSPSEIDNLPLNGRNYLDLATLVPGVGRSVSRSTERFAETSAVPGTGLAVQAQRNTGNSVLIDGLSANDDAADLAGTFVTQEVVREFREKW